MTKDKEAQPVLERSIVPLDVDDIPSKLKDPYLGSTHQHPFAIPENAEYWSNVYEKARYEGRHRFDPACQWDAVEEKKLVRKVCWTAFSWKYALMIRKQLDLRIMAWVWIMFSSLDLVRRNINRAVSDNMVTNVKMCAKDNR
jgi:hypothetical protein